MSSRSVLRRPRIKGRSGDQGTRAARVLQKLLGADELLVGSEAGQVKVGIPVGRLMEAARALQSDPGALYEMPICVTCVDWPERELRFEVVYLLRSLVHNDLAWITVSASESTEVPSLSGIFPGLEWHERECYDLFGIAFTGHPNLTRILLPADWEGHPLRKDYVSFGEPVAFTHNIEWALSAQDRPEYLPGATRGAVERP